MKYSKSDSVYFRKSKKENSIKGGKLKEDGNLENNDFFSKNRNNVVPNQNFKVQQKNGSFELKNMNPNNIDTPIKIMIQKNTQQPFIFFAYNPETKTYHLVCYINPDASNLHNNLIICKNLVIHENGSSEIVRLSHIDFLNIGTEELIVLCYNFLKIREKNHGFMNELFEYLKMFVFDYVLLNTQNNNLNSDTSYHNMVKEIKEMLRNEKEYKQRMENTMMKQKEANNGRMVNNWM